MQNDKEWANEADYVCDMLIQIGPLVEIGYCEKDRRISFESTLEGAKRIMGLIQFLDEQIGKQIENEIIEEKVDGIKQIKETAQTEIAVIKKLTKFNDSNFEGSKEYEEKFYKALEEFDLQYPKDW